MKPGRKALAGETLASCVDGQEQEWCRTQLPDATCVHGPGSEAAGQTEWLMRHAETTGICE